MTWRSPLAALVQWIGLGAIVGVFCGAASAVFLFLLGEVTGYRDGHEVIVYFLPLAGLVIGTLYARFGESIKAGNNLVIDTIHDDGPEIPFRMLPMVLGGTVLTHLFGGSAGREGTAVQMGASLADYLSHRARLGPELRGQLLAAGVAGGFGSVFGTPIAGAIFGLEFVVLGRIKYDALVPALVASLVGDLTTRALGIVHTPYPSAPHVELTALLCLKWLVFAVAVAFVSIAFIELTHFLKKHGEQRVKLLGLRMAIGGAILVVLWKLIGTSDYLGLGLPTIVRSFSDPQLPEWTFAAKLGFTAITLGAGFLGGEVTPLFFIGAALGNVLAPVLGIPRELGAGVGMAAVFASASNTPLALSIMAVELLGANVLPHVMIVCVVGYLISGHRSIYPAQRVTRRKAGGSPANTMRLDELQPSPTANAAPGSGSRGSAPEMQSQDARQQGDSHVEDG
ncbi:MAG: Chloride channel protein [Deltaproteobacteria bacterium]|nr:Chloride channel protein [Deltaproteobacteria bacterium]